MNTKTNNERLRELVEASKLSQAVALTIFNRGLGTSRLSESAWKALFANPGSARFRALDDESLAHAERVFAKLTGDR